MGAATNGAGNHEMAMPSNDAEPVHRVRVDGFWMDRTVVTNEQFEKFVTATGYVTVAERTPRQEDFPDAPPENLVAGSAVFTAPEHAVPLDNYLQWWSYVAGANWRHPERPASSLKGKGKYPVVQVAYPDAEATRNGRESGLPTEAEYEFAERGGLSGKTYPGATSSTRRKMDGQHLSGKISGPGHRRGWVQGWRQWRSFPPTVMAYTIWRAMYGNGAAIGIDLTIMQLAKAGDVTSNPQGPDTSFDPGEPSKKSVSNVEARSFVTMTIARATSSGRAAKGK